MAPGLPIVASTGLAEEATRAELQLLGVKWLLQKPYTHRSLLETVREALRGRGQ